MCVWGVGGKGERERETAGKKERAQSKQSAILAMELLLINEGSECACVMQRESESFEKEIPYIVDRAGGE